MIQKIITNKYVIISTYIFLLLFIISTDSITHDLYIRDDSAVFFSSGKAWMNGMLPYLDFADSKGPLLWLIYGIGYLISNYDYTGIFYLLVINYIVTFCIINKTLRLFFDERVSLYATLATSLFVFFPTYFNQTRAEMFCHPYISMGIFLLLKSIVTGNKYPLLSGIMLGFSVAACFLIKWTIAVEMISFVLSLFYYFLKQKTFIKYGVGILCGFLLLFLPFYGYMKLEGIYDNFVLEYFINTTKTVSMGFLETLEYYFLSEIPTLLSTPRVVSVLYLMPALLIFRKFTSNWIFGFMPFLCGTFFVAITAKHCINNHYINACSIFSVFVIIWMFNHAQVKKAFTRKVNIISFVVMLFCFISCFQMYAQKEKGMNSIFFYNQQMSKEFHETSYYTSQINKPRIICFDGEKGIGMSGAITLPACRYWTTQLGATKEMQEEPIIALKMFQADFVTCKVSNKEIRKIIEDCGYVRLMESTAYPGLYNFALYTKHRFLKVCPTDFSYNKSNIVGKLVVKSF